MNSPLTVRPLMLLMRLVPQEQWRYGQEPDFMSHKPQVLDIKFFHGLTGIEFEYDPASDTITWASRSIDGEDLEPWKVIDHLEQKVRDRIAHKKSIGHMNTAEALHRKLERALEGLHERNLNTKKEEANRENGQPPAFTIIDRGTDHFIFTTGVPARVEVSLVGEHIVAHAYTGTANDQDQDPDAVYDGTVDMNPISGIEALDRIANLLNGTEWEASNLDDIAELVSRTIKEPR